MQITEKLTTAGEHPLLLQGKVGTLEAILTVPEQLKSNEVVFLGHPHSLQGGTMNNKVVTTLARTFKDLGLPCLRFNFRGVGQSQGTYDAGIGESEDMLLLVREWQKAQPQAQFIFAGFSFGSYVAYRTAAQHPHRLLITVAPAIHNYNYQEFTQPPSPWLILQGEEDEVVSPELVFNFAAAANPALPVLRFANTTHFFHGKLIELKARLSDYLNTQAIP